MAQYDKKVSGVTSMLVKKAHGNKKIHHDVWNDELREKNRKKKKEEKIQNHNPFPIALYLCLVLAWMILFIPVPLVNYFISFPLLFASFVLSIICFTKKNIGHGITGFFMLFVISPIIYLFSMGMFLSLLSESLGRYTSRDVIHTNYQPVPTSISKPITQKQNTKISSLTKESQTRSNHETPKVKYKYLISTHDGRNIVADSFSVSGKTAQYSMGTIQVSMAKADIKSYKRLVME